MAEARRLAGVTFSPDMSPTRSRGPSVHYELVKSKLSLKPDGLEAYMDSLHRKRREREEKRRQVEQQRQVSPLRHTRQSDLKAKSKSDDNWYG